MSQTFNNLRVNPTAPETANDLKVFAKDDKLHTMNSEGTTAQLGSSAAPTVDEYTAPPYYVQLGNGAEFKASDSLRFISDSINHTWLQIGSLTKYRPRLEFLTGPTDNGFYEIAAIDVDLDEMRMEYPNRMISMRGKEVALRAVDTWDAKVVLQAPNGEVRVEAGEGFKIFQGWGGQQLYWNFDITTSHLVMESPRTTIAYKEDGDSPRQGVVTLVDGAAIVPTLGITDDSRIYLTNQNGGTSPGSLCVAARDAAGFTIASTSATDDAIVAWVVFDKRA